MLGFEMSRQMPCIFSIYDDIEQFLAEDSPHRTVKPLDAGGAAGGTKVSRTFSVMRMYACFSLYMHIYFFLFNPVSSTW